MKKVRRNFTASPGPGKSVVVDIDGEKYLLNNITAKYGGLYITETAAQQRVRAKKKSNQKRRSKR